MIPTNPKDIPVRIYAAMHIALANELRQSDEGPWLEDQGNQDLGSCLVREHDIITTTEEPLSTNLVALPSDFGKRSEITWKNGLKTGVMKKDGGLRPCIDFRKLNEVTVPDHFPLPRLEVVLEKVGNCNWYTSLDLSSGFLQIRLTERASRKCGIITEDDVFQMTHMPFGLRNATKLEGIAEFPACLSLSLESRLVMDKSVNMMTLRGADGNSYTVDLKLEQKSDHEATAFIKFIETGEMPEGMNETEKERMHADIVNWARSCITCQLRHMPTPGYRAEMKLPQSNTLFAKVGLDLAVPVQDAKAATLVKAFLSNCYLKFGRCTELITDNATAFTSEFFREFCSMLYISKRYATPHWSQGNAITERSFRTFHNIMSKYISPDQPDFDEHLDMVTFCYNTATHQSTGESPFFLMYGRDPIFCVDQMLDPRTAHAPMATDLAEFKLKLVSSLRSAWEATAAECADAQLRAKAQYDKLVRVLEALLAHSQTLQKRKTMPSKRQGQRRCKTWLAMTIMAKQYPLNLNPNSSQRRRKLCHGTLTI
uniref:Integrase catalytic domain-containing protein n=1 Tax=Globodera pallida TaxID=36090 RepID=A0A183C1B9_GLOPA